MTAPCIAVGHLLIVREFHLSLIIDVNLTPKNLVFNLSVGTLDDGYLCKVPLPSRAPQIQNPGHVTCAAVTERDKSDTCYLQVPHIPTWSDLVR